MEPSACLPLQPAYFSTSTDPNAHSPERTLFYFALPFCFLPFLNCFLSISFLVSLKSLFYVLFLALSVSPVSARALRRLLSMAGSFDSHFARNMMWQCQLSQPDCRCYRVDGYSLLKRLPLHPLIGPRCPVQSVGQWLDNIGLVQYENHLLSNGFDNVQFMVSVSFTLPSLFSLQAVF